MSINQTFNYYYLEMWLLNKTSCEIQILNEKVWKLMIENGELREENRKLKSERDKWRGKYNRLKSEFNLLKNKIWTTQK